MHTEQGGLCFDAVLRGIEAEVLKKAQMCRRDWASGLLFRRNDTYSEKSPLVIQKKPDKKPMGKFWPWIPTQQITMVDPKIYHQVARNITGWWLKKHLEKYEFVNGKDDIPYIVEKNMFETTKQIRY